MLPNFINFDGVLFDMVREVDSVTITALGNFIRVIDVGFPFGSF